MPVGALHLLALIGTFAPAGRTAERERVPARLPRSVETIPGPNPRGPRPGLILGLQLTRVPTPIVTATRERELLILTCATDTLWSIPPLVITDEEVRNGLAILEERP